MKHTLYIFLGKSASGKSSIMKEFVKKDDKLKRIIEITTRPKRESEEDGTDYRFVSDEEFENGVRNKEIIGISCYEKDKGCWKYGIQINDIRNALTNESDSVLVTNPIAFEQMVKNGILNEMNLVVVYVHRKLKERLKASIERDTLENSEEILHRFLRDEKDFHSEDFLSALNEIEKTNSKCGYKRKVIHIKNNSKLIKDLIKKIK